ncbi:hypothetical protein HHI36_023827 [Cryptolaemus montrouzieri]|uniref:Uncharacterized protein n=1 Tax=Cryptolaemus montrouzieri TaxID=559131 RepID=A0ABD2PJ93_9CUCU
MDEDDDPSNRGDTPPSGHIASRCPLHTTNQPASALASSPIPSTQHRQTQITPEGTTFEKTDKILTMQPNSSNTGNNYNTVQIKRIHNEIVSPTADTHSQPEINFTKPLLKKPKHETKANENKCKIMTDFFLPVKDLIEAHSPPFVLTYDELTDLFSNLLGANNQILLAQDYTNDLSGLNYMIEEIQPALEDRILKSRCTKFRKKLKRYLDGIATDSESDTSQDPNNY